MNPDTGNTIEYDSIKHFLDPDIRESMEKKVKGIAGIDYERGTTYFMANSALVATNLQLIKMIRNDLNKDKK